MRAMRSNSGGYASRSLIGLRTTPSVPMRTWFLSSTCVTGSYWQTSSVTESSAMSSALTNCG